MVQKILDKVDFPEDHSDSGDNAGRSHVIFSPDIDVTLLSGEHLKYTEDEMRDAIVAFSSNLIKAGDTPGKIHELPQVSLADALVGKAIPDNYLVDVGETGLVVPSAFNALLVGLAQYAEGIGFDPQTSRYNVQYGHNSPDGDKNHMLHSDGIGVRPPPAADTTTVKAIREVYSPHGGTVLSPDPNHKITGEPVRKYPLHESPMRTAQLGTLPDADNLEVDAQQVLPGKVLAFDPSQDFWHQSPESDGTRFAVLVNINQVDSQGWRY